MSTAVLQFAVGGIEIVLLLFLFVCSIIVPLVVSYFIYRDAKRRNSRHALAWGLGSFFGAVVVWLLYAIVRDEVGSGGPR
ncbi:hypothetical protein [Natrinema sp. 1APR25-10V2]|uniref:hypothetical protein n=1 Tax=Natrinema sp. 1APR25-10V2 TaxID=2951081 RepID=UPI00287559A9|nr:hypothetical protein [Natrinema sp. 1APR25-10V2]MDS0476556.1 hypothetical protein [Natrinema sp. 1APR25-10V2]